MWAALSMIALFIGILSKAFSKKVAPDQVIAYGVDKAIELIRIDRAGVGTK
ncbi:hypothetical protein [Ideonella alba]|uniref:Uncharacterized protein n=1 Tax=Ideonella alba TaxID=2824118 RepID=A0A941BNQ5_9BURK|nr:hypothetical protein [Ideonella alba]MBQ0933589.1 hypothetical protein [Ideonella alba]